MESEEWAVLSGCNACINSQLCNKMGNCALLNIDIIYPENNKQKRDYIRRLRGGICRPDLMAQELSLKVQPKKEKEVVYRTKQGKVNLTTIEKMFISYINKPR